MIRFLSLSLLVLLAGGCSQVERIGADAESIRDSASSTQGHLSIIMAEADGREVIVEEAEAAMDEQENILDRVSSIQIALPKVRDATPWWANLISQLTVAASVLGVAFLIWHLGVGHIIKKMFWAIGWFIPASAIRSAEVDMKAEQDRLSWGETVAARRGSDSAYEAARQQIKKRNVT